jgi:hypothetical protein
MSKISPTLRGGYSTIVKDNNGNEYRCHTYPMAFEMMALFANLDFIRPLGVSDWIGVDDYS